MNKFVYLFLLLFFGFAGNTNAQTRQVENLIYESFENNSPTVGDWTNSNESGCSVNWGIYEQAGIAAKGTDKFVGYQSSAAASGCYSTLLSPEWVISKKGTNDSLRITFYIFRTSTVSDDFVNFYIVDEFGDAISDIVTVEQYNQSPPATNTGWVELVWRVPFSKIAPSGTKKVRFAATGVSGNSINLYLDEIEVNHVYYSTTQPKVVQINYPSTGSSIVGATDVNISCMAQGVSGIKLEFSEDGGLNWSDIGTLSPVPAQNFAVKWNVPGVSTTKAMLRISDISDANVKHTVGPFTIVPALEFLSFSSPATFYVGDQIDIKWKAAHIIDYVNIEYSSNGGVSWNPIANYEIASSGSYKWTAPSTEMTGLKFRISNSDEPSTYVVSPTFDVLYPIQLTNFNGGDTALVGQTFPIQWTAAPTIAKVNISFTTNGGVNWNNIASNVDASLGSYSWIVPDVPSPTVKVRVANTNDASQSDESDSYFSIVNKTGIGESISSEGLNVYPNPAQGTIYVKLTEQLKTGAQLSIVDVTGKEVYSAAPKTGESVLTVDLNHLPAGVYNMLLRNDGKISSQRIVLQ